MEIIIYIHILMKIYKNFINSEKKNFKDYINKNLKLIDQIFDFREK